MGLISNKKTNMRSELIKHMSSADEIYMNVSFIRDSGLKLLIKNLKEAVGLGKKIKILTSDYMQVTEPTALYRLLEIPGVRLFDNKKNISFHPKTYLFKTKGHTDAFVGSSNISYSALVSGVEWNYLTNSKLDKESIDEILEEFDELYENNSFELTLEWLREYEKSYRQSDLTKTFDTQNIPKDKNQKGTGTELETFGNSQIVGEIEPIKFQIPALYELSKTREEGYQKAMVVVGTGLGKTYLSAFDSKAFNRVLFVVHRDEILQDAKKTFETVYGNTKTYGFFKGDQKDTDKDIIFASIATLGKEGYLKDDYFPKDYFDYIVVDEFHHSDAPTYRNLLGYFTPKFLLGLTATPDRADNGDIYELCDYNIAYQCDFRVGINNGWLTPFEYFGIYDDTDYSEIPWRNGKYDLEKLENKLIVEKRVELVYKKYLEYRKKSTIAFCAGVRHCKIMYEYFKSKGIKSAMVVGDTPLKERQKIISDFKNGKLEIIFVVDVFNEGVDIPCVDTMLFLSPTASYTIFIQQLDRGLRTYEGKEKLRVLDFVGNYKGAELRASFLAGKVKSKGKKGEDKEILSPIDSKFQLPSGCTASFDFKLIELIEEKKGSYGTLKERLVIEFQRVKEVLGKVPTIMEMNTYGELPVNAYKQNFGSWYEFLKSVGGLSEEQKKYTELEIKFLEFLESTSMTKSYKIPLLMGLLEKENLKISFEEVGERFKRFYSDKVHGKDLGDKKHKDWRSWEIKDFTKLAKDNPIHFLTKDGKNEEFFVVTREGMEMSKGLGSELPDTPGLREFAQEILRYRNVQYFKRKYME